MKKSGLRSLAFQLFHGLIQIFLGPPWPLAPHKNPEAVNPDVNNVCEL